MSSAPYTRPSAHLDEILASTKISLAYSALTGMEPRRTGPDRWRAVAGWRGGDGQNVSLDDDRGIWHDFVTGEGGGVLDLIVRNRGGSRQDALRWLAEFVGIPLEDQPLSDTDLRAWAQEQALISQELPRAKHWRHAALELIELLLDSLKSQFFDPLAVERPTSLELQYYTRQQARLARLEGAELVVEFRSWARRQPTLTSAMVRWARTRATAAERAIREYLRQTEAA